MPMHEHQKRTKKKGRAPAHQNTFAYRHNPKSKKTARILASPIVGTCRRCTNKLLWRKKYRKYKPLTQRRNCNLCKQPKITAAYHTVCPTCSVESDQARKLLADFAQEYGDCKRVCEVCFKAPVGAVSSSSSAPTADDQDDNTATNTDRPLRLREVKKRQRQAERSKARKEMNDGAAEDDVVQKLDELEESEARGTRIEVDDQDALLQAVGGPEELLTGDAYQRKLLLRGDRKKV